jgi:hypothetical protein
MEYLAMNEALTREREVTVKSLAHQLVCKWAGSRMLIGLNQQNGDIMRRDIIDLILPLMAESDADLRTQLTEAQQRVRELEARVKGQGALMKALKECPDPHHTIGLADQLIGEKVLALTEAQATIAAYQAREELHGKLSERVRLQERIEELEKAPLAIVEGFRAVWQKEKDQLQAELTHYRHACQSIGETDGHGWAETTKELRNTVTTQAEEMGRLRIKADKWDCFKRYQGR